MGVPSDGTPKTFFNICKYNMIDKYEFFSSTKSTINKYMPVDKGNLFVLFQKTRLDVLTIIYVAVSNKLLYRRAEQYTMTNYKCGYYFYVVLAGNLVSS